MPRPVSPELICCVVYAERKQEKIIVNVVKGKFGVVMNAKKVEDNAKMKTIITLFLVNSSGCILD